MLLHPLAENTLKFLQKFKHEIGKIKAWKITLKSGFGWPRMHQIVELVLAPQEPVFGLVWLQGFFHFSFAFCPKKYEQTNTKISFDFGSPFSLENSATNPM